VARPGGAYARLHEMQWLAEEPGADGNGNGSLEPGASSREPEAQSL
jgi:hypothetical protein